MKSTSVFMLLGCFLWVVLGEYARMAQAQEEGLIRRGLPALNLGGWTDEVVFRGWRIQRHAVLGHYRLTDTQGRRKTFGSYETCLEALEKAKREVPLEPLSKHVVLVLHGHGATPWFMQGLTDYLGQHTGWQVENVGYASTLEDIPRYAKSLDNVIRHLDGVEKIDFVAHSMGNIVIRRYLGDRNRALSSERQSLTFGRFVMISPPNHGAEIVDLLKEMVADRDMVVSVAEFLAGESSKELAPRQGWPVLEKSLAVPDFEFGVIAGGKGDSQGYLAQLPGDDDGLLTVESMRLVGASDFVQVKGLHQLMPTLHEVRELTLKYLQHGYFISPDRRQTLR